MVDPRTYVDRIFFDSIDGNLVPKDAHTIDCSDGVPMLPSDKILVLENYKKNKQRGRKDPLEGSTVIQFPTDKQPLLIPLEEGLKMAIHLHSYMTSFLEKYESFDEERQIGV